MMVLISADNDVMHRLWGYCTASCVMYSVCFSLRNHSSGNGAEKTLRGCGHFLIPLSAADADCVSATMVRCLWKHFQRMNECSCSWFDLRILHILSLQINMIDFILVKCTLLTCRIKTWCCLLSLQVNRVKHLTSRYHNQTSQVHKLHFVLHCF